MRPEAGRPALAERWHPDASCLVRTPQASVLLRHATPEVTVLGYEVPALHPEGRHWARMTT